MTPDELDRYLLDLALADPTISSRIDNKSDRDKLFRKSRVSPLHRTLFAGQDAESILLERWNIWPEFVMQAANIPVFQLISNYLLWEYICAIAQFVKTQEFMVFGIAGPAGAGKTTLATLVRTCLKVLQPDRRFIQLSLDDFHKPKAVRRAEGIRWRATPGSHNIELASEVLDKIRRGNRRIEVPRYHAAIDDISHVDVVHGPISVALLDGWFVGRREDGYDVIADRVDYLIYLDCPLELAKQRRFDRVEARIQVQDEQIKKKLRKKAQAFWDEVQRPGYDKWVRPIQSIADLVVSFRRDGTISRSDQLT